MTGSLENVLKAIGPLDAAAMAAARKRQDNLTKPLGSLGRLEELSVQIAGIRGEAIPSLEHKAIVTMAADHGVVAQGVSLYPQEVTRQMVFNFLRGGAAINVLTRHAGARVIVVDMGVKGDFPELPGLLKRKIAHGTQDMSQGPAMTREQAVAALETGIAIVEDEMRKGLDIVGTGDMGIGNTTASAAILSAISGLPPDRVTGRGTGVGTEQLAHKMGVIHKALSVNQPDPRDALDVLTKVGGFEIGGLAGVILGGAARRIPVVIDGFISGAAALIATGLSPQVKGYLIPAHVSAEAGHRLLLDFLKLRPLVNLDMRLGEGTAATLGIFLAEAAVKILSGMATFAEAAVSEAEPPQSKS